MRRVRHLLTILLLASFIVLSGGVGWAAVSLPAFSTGELQTPLALQEDRGASTTMLFVGDVMLARHVERLSRRFGTDYPWRGVQPLFESVDAVVVNFESAIPQVHRPTADFTFRFSTPSLLVEPLAALGVTHASLANNHSYDFGAAEYVHTREQLMAEGIEPFGHPYRINDLSVTYVTSGDSTIALVGIHTLFRTPTREELADFLTSVKATSDIQIAYIHWGIEYAYEPSEQQQSLAATLVSLGVSAIIGHHPHVVQSIGIVDEVPVFYSLGNFIFDQYFNPSVQEGLALRVYVSDSELEYELIPVTSRATRSQPHVMTGEEKKQFLLQLAQRSNARLQSDIVTGRITQRLATSPQNSMMTE